jgi:ornithine cyclodeaminase/alanine dehydrogenase-like protein (mu-crystallin family)
MPTLPHFDAAAIAELVSLADTVGALRSAFAQPLHHVERVNNAVAGGDYITMNATLEASLEASLEARSGDGNEHAVAGTKILMVQPRNAGTERPLISGSYCLFDADRGCPLATMDGAALTNLRTPAA